MHQIVEERLGVEDDLPCADYALLVPLKRSRAYGAVRKRVADLRPADAWLQDGLHFFVFDLHPPAGDGAPAERPVAVFAMLQESREPVSAVVVTPGAGGAAPEVVDLRPTGPGEPAPESPPAVPAVNTVAALRDT